MSTGVYSIEAALFDAPILSLNQIRNYLTSIPPEQLREYASRIPGPGGLGLLLTADALEQRPVRMSCSYLNQHIDLVHDWHAAQSEHNDLN